MPRFSTRSLGVILYRYLPLFKERSLTSYRTVLRMPSWFPGAGFKRHARKWSPIVDNAIQSAFDKVKGELVSPPRRLAAQLVPPTTERMVHQTPFRLQERRLHLLLRT